MSEEQNNEQIENSVEEELLRENKQTDTPSQQESTPTATAFRLTIIVLVVALMLVTVNYFTKNIIAANERLEGETARGQLFENAEFTSLDITALSDKSFEDVTAVYRVTSDGKDAGYCVDILAAGFSSDKMLITVGVSSDTVSIVGVRTVFHSETSGIGSKVADNDGEYLLRYVNRTQSTIDGVSAVSGATVSSDAVKQAVKTALSAAKIIAGGARNG